MAGIKIGALNLFGGGARNDILPQLKADIFEGRLLHLLSAKRVRLQQPCLPEVQSVFIKI